ncbi:putative arginase family protein [Diplodia seriata]|uniref:Putative arginase family protein n=1 Tax=Diplodia seriata TaxID=420778 RepID=A0A0G2EIV5_9PEZI|nr:putative arginase family protein [Diplodia seriata]
MLGGDHTTTLSALRSTAEQWGPVNVIHFDSHLDTWDPKVLERLKQRVGDSKVYISVDIDVLDPAFAPATGTAEPGGWSSRELLSILDGLSGLSVIGADIVEVSPVWDNVGETTMPVKSKAEELR